MQFAIHMIIEFLEATLISNATAPGEVLLQPLGGDFCGWRKPKLGWEVSSSGCHIVRRGDSSQEVAFSRPYFDAVFVTP